MMKNRFKYTVSFFIYSFISCFSLNSYGADMNFDHVSEEFLKGASIITKLARQCKSERNGEGCYEEDRQILKRYAVYFCGEMPENTHPLSEQYFEQYIRLPMLNTALIRVWSLLNGGNFVWPSCVICLFNYPYDPYWEQNISFCDSK